VNGQEQFPLLLVAGLSGAGKSTVLDVFEDLRFFAVEGLPGGLASKMYGLFQGQSQLDFRGLALGIDLRHKGSLREWLAAVDELTHLGAPIQMVFIEAKDEVLVRRYATTRRPHPLAHGQAGQGEQHGALGLENAIRQEREQLAPLRKMADLVIDTSDYSVHDLRRAIQEKWSTLEGAPRSLAVHLITFGFKYGVPSEADMVFDLRFLPNPYFDKELRPFTGKDPAVAAYVLDKEPGRGFLPRLVDFMQFQLPLFEAEGRYRLTIALGCTGGRHRSVATAEALREALKKSDYRVSLEHRHLELG